MKTLLLLLLFAVQAHGILYTKNESLSSCEGIGRVKWLHNNKFEENVSIGADVISSKGWEYATLLNTSFKGYETFGSKKVANAMNVHKMSQDVLFDWSSTTFEVELYSVAPYALDIYFGLTQLTFRCPSNLFIPDSLQNDKDLFLHFGKEKRRLQVTSHSLKVRLSTKSSQLYVRHMHIGLSTLTSLDGNVPLQMSISVARPQFCITFWAAESPMSSPTFIIGRAEFTPILKVGWNQVQVTGIKPGPQILKVVMVSNSEEIHSDRVEILLLHNFACETDVVFAYGENQGCQDQFQTAKLIDSGPCDSFTCSCGEKCHVCDEKDCACRLRTRISSCSLRPKTDLTTPATTPTTTRSTTRSTTEQTTRQTLLPITRVETTPLVDTSPPTTPFDVTSPATTPVLTSPDKIRTTDRPTETAQTEIELTSTSTDSTMTSSFPPINFNNNNNYNKDDDDDDDGLTIFLKITGGAASLTITIVGVCYLRAQLRRAFNFICCQMQAPNGGGATAATGASNTIPLKEIVISAPKTPVSKPRQHAPNPPSAAQKDSSPYAGLPPPPQKKGVTFGTNGSVSYHAKGAIPKQFDFSSRSTTTGFANSNFTGFGSDKETARDADFGDTAWGFDRNFAVKEFGNTASGGSGSFGGGSGIFGTGGVRVQKMQDVQVGGNGTGSVPKGAVGPEKPVNDGVVGPEKPVNDGAVGPEKPINGGGTIEPKEPINGGGGAIGPKEPINGGGGAIEPSNGGGAIGPKEPINGGGGAIGPEMDRDAGDLETDGANAQEEETNVKQQLSAGTSPANKVKKGKKKKSQTHSPTDSWVD